MEATEHQQLDSAEVLGEATIMLSAEQKSPGYTRTNQDQPGEGSCMETGHHGGMHPCRARPDVKCCKHIVQTKYFTNRTKTKKFNIRQKLGCKSKDALYLAWCDKCNAEQYVGKVESQKAHRRINKHRNDVKRENSIKIDQHFRAEDHNFDRDFRIIIIEEITNKNMTREQVRTTLLKREDFWIKKLGTLEPNGFNDKLNFPNAD